MKQEYYDTKNHIKTEKALDDDYCWLQKLKICYTDELSKLIALG